MRPPGERSGRVSRSVTGSVCSVCRAVSMRCSCWSGSGGVAVDQRSRPLLGVDLVEYGGDLALVLLVSELEGEFFVVVDPGRFVRGQGRGGEWIGHLMSVLGVLAEGVTAVAEHVPVPFVAEVRGQGADTCRFGRELGGDGALEFGGECAAACGSHGFFECDIGFGVPPGRVVVEVGGVVCGAEGFGVDDAPVDGAVGVCVGELVGDEEHGNGLDALGLFLDGGEVLPELCGSAIVCAVAAGIFGWV